MTPKRRRTPNVRGGRPTDHEILKMTGLGYANVADAAAAVSRAASSIYDLLRRIGNGDRQPIPQVDPTLKVVVKTNSGNVWIHLESLRKFYDPAPEATP
jgi:hypothetical protein